MKPCLSACFAAAIAAFAFSASAQSYPTKPIRIVVPYAAGGATDTYARVYGHKFTEAWGQQVIVDNRPGAGGNIGSAVVAKATPDGYTILLNTSGQAIAPALYRQLTYDAVKELQAVVMMTRGAYFLSVSPALPVSNLRELLALAKAQPGKLNFGTTGIGSGPHLAGELLRSLAAIDIVHVPYKGDSSLVPALVANEVQLSFLPAQAAMPMVKSGKLRPLGVASGSRSIFLPDVPTVMEGGVPGYDLTTWAGLFVPGGTPRDIVQKISAEGVRMMKAPDVEKIVASWGVEGIGMGVDEFEVRYRADVEMYARLVRDAKIPQVD